MPIFANGCRTSEQLDYSKTKNRKDLIDTFIYKVILYDNKMKILFHLKGGQQSELLLNLIFPEYPDGHGEEERNGDKIPENEKETDKSVSFSSGCAYTPVMVEVTGLEPTTSWSLTKRATKLRHTSLLCSMAFDRMLPIGHTSRRGKTA